MKSKLNKTNLDKGLAEFKEKLRLYCLKRLKSESARRKATKVIGYEYSYIVAALGQRNKGGIEFWFKMVCYCTSLEIDGIDQKINDFFSLDNPFKSLGDFSEADIIFKQLSEIPIVNEDAKYQLAINLRDLLLDLNNNLVKRLRRSGKLK